MINRINGILDRLLAKLDGLYDQECRLLGNLNLELYSPEYLKTHFRTPGPRALHSYRESLVYATGLLFRGTLPERVEEIVSAFLNHGQIKDQSNPDFGQLYWFQEEKHIRDRNGNFFNSSALFIIFKFWRARLSPKTAAKLESALQLLHPVFVREREEGTLTYVNPALGKRMMCMLLAETFSLPSLQDDRRSLIEYADFLLQSGVNENLSPAYFNVDIFILLMGLTGTSDLATKQKLRQLLTEIFLHQALFFKERFPLPFRRGYNGDYRGRRDDILPYIFGWSDDFKDRADYYTSIGLPVMIGLAYSGESALFEQDKSAEKYPRELSSRIYQDCTATSFLDRKFSLGSFNYYPPDSTVWQTVATGGSGWQDGTVYFSVTNKQETTAVLRLEAIDEDGIERIHPYEGAFSLDKVGRIYPFLSFPPEPKLYCRQHGSKLLCLYKIDRVDAILRRLGFNIHFSRFDGKVFRPDGGELALTETPLIHGGPVIIQISGVHVLLSPLNRVDMGGSTLLKGDFIMPQLSLRLRNGSLDCSMYNYDGAPKRFTQNHISGGFFLMAASDMIREDFLNASNRIVIREEFISDRMNAHIDRRDGIRKVEIKTVDGNLAATWDHYSGKME